MTSTSPAIDTAAAVRQANPQRDYTIAWAATFLFFIVIAGVHARLWFCDVVLHVCLLCFTV